MAINQDYPVLDGIEPSWADVKIEAEIFDGPLIDMKDIQSINTSRSLDIGVSRGASGGRKKRRTTGQGDEEASWTLYRTGFQNLLRNLMSVAPVRGNQRLVSLVHFNISYSYSPPGSTEIFERKILGCRISGDTMNDAEGSDPQTVEVPLSVASIVDVIDGKEVVLI
jgi:hypothetical protein